MRGYWVTAGALLLASAGCGGSGAGSGEERDADGGAALDGEARGDGGGTGDGDGAPDGSSARDGGAPVDGAASGGDAATPTPFAECAGEASERPPNNPLCLVGDDSPDPEDPDVFGVIEHDFVTYEGVDAVHIRITLDPTFVDNTYGANQCGWTVPGHSFGDLEESDRCEVVVLDATGEVMFDLAIDYISEDPDSPCGYSSLGVTGGEGAIHVGDADAILAVRTSLSENFNEREHCLPEASPPAGDDCCTPPADAADWDFRVVYEVWLARSAFEPQGFGSAYMSHVHASPSKLGPGNNTVEVTPESCDDVCLDPDGCDEPQPCPDPDGCDEPDAGSGGCTDPDGCDEPESCTANEECSEGQFCYEGDCVDIVI